MILLIRREDIKLSDKIKRESRRKEFLAKTKGRVNGFTLPFVYP